MPTQKMGFEGQVFTGTAGSTGATQVLNLEDISITMDVETGDSTVRGDGSIAPINTEEVTARSWSAEFTAKLDSSDTVVEGLRVAQATGTGIALRMKDYAAGKGYDGDVILSLSHDQPLKGEQKIKFTAKPSRGYGRAPQLYV